MATLSDGFGGVGGSSGGYGGGTSGQYGPLASQTYYADPNAAGGLIQQLMQNMQQQQGNLNSFIANPTASPLFQGQLSGLLGALAPDEARGATQLQDVFRNAGNTSSSVFGDAAQNYQSGVQRNHQELASKLLGQSFQQIVQALLPQIQQGPQLLEAMRLSQQYRAPQQQTSGGSIQQPTQQPNNSLQQLISALSGQTNSDIRQPGIGQGSWNNANVGNPPPTPTTTDKPKPEPLGLTGGSSFNGDGSYYKPIQYTYTGGGENPITIYAPEGSNVESVDFPQ